MLVRKAFAILLPCILISPIGGQVTLEADLLVWYKLNETAGTTAEDSTSNGHAGTLVGMDDADWVDGKFGKGLDFGGDDRLQIPLDVFENYEGKTMSMWIKTARAHTDAAHIYYGSPATGGDGFGGQMEYHLNFVANNNRLQFYIHSTGGVTLTSGTALNDDQWHLVTLVNEPGTYTLYVDGGRIFKGVHSNSPTPYGFTHYHQLGEPPANRRQYIGLLDDFRIYSVALDEEDVQGIYRDGLGDFDKLPTVTLNGEELVRIAQGGTYTEESAVAKDPVDGALALTTEYFQPGGNPLGVTAESNLVAWWKFDDDAVDASGSGNDGGLVGGAAFAEGKFGKALNLDGTDDAMEVAAFQGVAFGATVSISAWVNPVSIGTETTVDGAVFSGNGNTLFWVDHSAGTVPEPASLSFNSGDIGDATNKASAAEGILTVSEWQHVVAVMDGANRTIFHNGDQVITAAVSAQTTVALDGNKVEVGGSNGDADMWFEGMVDDVRVYSHALDATEIGAIYNGGAGETIPGPPNTVDASVLGDWKVVYSSADQLGQTASATRTVRVFDPQSPVITLVDVDAVTHEAGAAYTPPQVTVQDAGGGELDANQIQTTGTVDPDVPGSYTLQYDFTDDQQRLAETVFQTVNVVDTTAPDISVTGAATIKHQLGHTYRDPGAMATDFVDGDTHPMSSLYTPNQLVRRGGTGGNNESLLVLMATVAKWHKTLQGKWSTQSHWD